ncbi:MAG TPA: hypothetical protein PLV45_06860, partial [bacterium]|nr:hypothetical protein [bacterium]
MKKKQEYSTPRGGGHRIVFRLAAILFGIFIITGVELLLRIAPPPQEAANPHSMQHILKGLKVPVPDTGDYRVSHPLLREHRTISLKKQDDTLRLILAGIAVSAMFSAG